MGNRLKHSHQHGEFLASTVDGCYYTNCNSEGLWFQNRQTGETNQLLGNCQFHAVSFNSWKRKIRKYLKDYKN